MSENFINQVWYGAHPLAILLAPLAWVFSLVVKLRRTAYQLGVIRQHRINVPVIIVGNLTVGGTGKTPFVIALANFLKEQGYHPGIIVRGYRGLASSWPQQVRADSDPVMVGDEAVILARRTDCPVAAGPNRVATASALLNFSNCDLIISDDGLQHYSLARDIEIVLIDGIRRFGNKQCLPAGPLREPLSRQQTVDLLVTNGIAGVGEFAVKNHLHAARHLKEDAEEKFLDDFKFGPVHALAGIANPEQFFQTLERAGLNIIRHPYNDHAMYTHQDIDFKDDLPILMTEKDAVKCVSLAGENHWYVPMSVELTKQLQDRLLTLLNRLK